MAYNATSTTSQAFGGDEFSNNLFSDLAPLLTLFGEQVTKQFLSMSMGWADDILLAMGPLGIMTVIVSAIRVGGVKVLKAFVGRARESRANAEKEILSSTSEDVCELWTGQEIVRELGNPEGMKDLILLENPITIDNPRQSTQDETIESKRVLDIASAYSNRILAPNDIDEEDLINISNGAPNIALNVRNSTASRKELIALAVVGTVLQIGGLIFPAITTYFLKWRKGGSAIAGYGYPCFATGTIAVIVGVVFCGRVIEGSTTEHEFDLSRSRDTGRVQVMRLQRACTVSDQHFPSYAIFNSPQDSRIRTSRLNRIDHSRMAAFGTLTAVIGFVAQFVGLRALHWSATIVQLGIMLIMTAIRSWVRRGLAEDPKFYEILDGHELSWVALYIFHKDRMGWSRESTNRPLESINGPNLHSEDNSKTIHTTAKGPHSQSRQSSEPVQPHIAGVPTPEPNYVKWAFKKQFPYILWNKNSQKVSETQPFDEMLDSILRWEPLVGHWGIEQFEERVSDTPEASIPASMLETVKIEISRLTRVFCTLPALSQERGNDNDENVQAHTQPLDIYRDLQRLTPITGEAIDCANNLALAMERTMAFLTKSDHVLWKDEGSPVNQRMTSQGLEKFEFNVNIVEGSYRPKSAAELHPLELQLTGELQDPKANSDEIEHRNYIWTADRDILSAILSMWLFALDVRKAVATKATAISRRMAGLRIETWRRPWETISRRNVYFRILSRKQNISGERKPENESTLRQWLFGQIESVPPLYSRHIHDEVSGSYNSWCVWGTSNSRMLDQQNPRTSEETDPHKNDLAILTRPDTTISQHCALDLFGYFMDAVAARIQKLGGRTRPIIGLPFSETHRWSNSVFEVIANECVTAGLAHDVAEAYTVIIPAFMKHKLLPTESGFESFKMEEK